MNTLDLLKIILGSSIVTTAFLTIMSLIAKTWVVERIKLALQKEHTKFNTDLQWEVKVRERAERVAEYISLARSLKEGSTEDEYRKANRLSWELAMWLPDEIYRQMVGAIANPNESNNELTVVVEVRKLLLKEKAGNLTENQIAHHAPGIGKK
jgi:hypothetical protein